ncbi:MAG: transglycosylase SLT domain-containing protein [Candidatus Binatia bacterium]
MIGSAVGLSGALRWGAVVLVLAALGVIVQPRHAKPPVAAAPPPAASGVAQQDVAQRPGTWSLRAGGWYIRVDGAEVPVPALSELTAAPPHVRLAITISPYDRLIAHHAEAEGFDWRLVAALIFEESGFNPFSRSDKGAVGLMQVRPIAAESVGAAHFELPADNVQAGVRYLRQLDDMFQGVTGRERLPVVLAAYNIGPGHVRDAQTLARRFGYDPNRWESALELMLPLLEEPSLYAPLPNGYAKGRETVAYVQRILDRYERYRAQTAVSVDVD